MRTYFSRTILATLFVLSACAQDENLMVLLKKALPPNLEPQINDSCTSFLGLGPSVAIFDVSQKVPVGPTTPIKVTHNGNSWSRHNSMHDFVNERSRASVGIGATLLDGKKCLRNLTERADLFLFGESPGIYYASGNEQVVIILFDNPKGTGAILVQSP